MILEKKIPLGYLVGIIKWDILLIALFTAFTHTLTTYVFKFTLPVGVGTFMGTAIALILSFKLSQSYDRWWEARKIWGSIVNDSRTLVVQLKSFVKSAEDPRIIEMANRQMGWCHALSESLRKKDAIAACQEFVSKEELQEVSKFTNIPMALANKQSQNLRILHGDGQLNDFQQMQIDSTLVRLVASMGQAERIKNTDFPRTYRITLHFFIYLFLGLLSFSFTSIDLIIYVPILVLISVPFFLLEKIAYHIQDPFEDRPTDTATTAISETIEGNIKQLLDPNHEPVVTESTTYYLM